MRIIVLADRTRKQRNILFVLYAGQVFSEKQTNSIAECEISLCEVSMQKVI